MTQECLELQACVQKHATRPNVVYFCTHWLHCLLLLRSEISTTVILHTTYTSSDQASQHHDHASTTSPAVAGISAQSEEVTQPNIFGG